MIYFGAKPSATEKDEAFFANNQEKFAELVKWAEMNTSDPLQDCQYSNLPQEFREWTQSKTIWICYDHFGDINAISFYRPESNLSFTYLTHNYIRGNTTVGDGYSAYCSYSLDDKWYLCVINYN